MNRWLRDRYAARSHYKEMEFLQMALDCIHESKISGNEEKTFWLTRHWMIDVGRPSEMQWLETLDANVKVWKCRNQWFYLLDFQSGRHQWDKGYVTIDEAKMAAFDALMRIRYPSIIERERSNEDKNNADVGKTIGQQIEEVIKARQTVPTDNFLKRLDELRKRK